MIRVLQLPGFLVGSVAVVLTVTLAILGLVVFRRVFPESRLDKNESVAGHVFNLAGVLYAVLVAFVVVVVWQQFTDAEKGTEAEAAAISDLLRDSTGLPVANRPALQQGLIAYTDDVINDEFPRMRRGEYVEQQSIHLTTIWNTFVQVQPVTESEISFFRQSITKLDELGTARKARLSSSRSEISNELWILLLGGGLVMLFFTYMFTTPDFLVHSVLIALAGALLAFVLYIIFAFEHPFIGSIAVSSEAYQHVLEQWAEVTP